jgi:hypothetical protein
METAGFILLDGGISGIASGHRGIWRPFFDAACV